MTQEWLLQHELRHGEADLFFEIAGSACAWVDFTIRDRQRLSEEGNSFLSECEPHLHDVTTTDEWPGTTLLDSTAERIRFEFTREIRRTIAAFEPNVLGWTEPRLPEDMTLIRTDGSVFLGSVTHEHDIWLNLFLNEVEEFQTRAPNIFKGMRPREGI